jgi:DNA polymerase III subunit delta'
MKKHALIEQTQPVVYQTLVNAFKNQKVNHAFLLSGQKGAPIKESAVFLAQSLVCENANPLACEECISCLRIANESYADYILIDGEKGTIKKEEIETLQSSFAKSGVEVKALKVYIIHLFEKATASAINSLLKFLEEPYDDVIGIITTENQAQILDTIVSRCQVLRIKTYSKEYLEQELANNQLSEEDINILVNKYSDINQILEVLNTTNYPAIKELVINTFNLLINHRSQLNYFVIKDLIPIIKERSNTNLFLDLLETIIADVIRLKVGEKVLFSSQKEQLAKALHSGLNLESYKQKIVLAQGSMSFNLNTSLLLDSLFYKLRYEKDV